MGENENIELKRTWRDNIFRHLFKDGENFVEMYEVFTGKKLLPDEIEFRDTDSIVMSKDLKNDIAFITQDGNFICLVEHQRSKCPNIGLRLLIYYGELLKIHVQKHGLNIYGTVPIKYPKAEFFVAYNGKKPWVGDDCIVAGDVTINVKIVDINYDQLEIQEKDNALSGYAYLVKQIEYYITEVGLVPGFAADRALKDCRSGGYLTNYVNKEEFLTMVTEVWTIEQQAADRERWAREEERAKAEERVFTIEQQAADRERWAREEERAKAEEKVFTIEQQAADREQWAREEEQKKAEEKVFTIEQQAVDRERWAREEERKKAEEERLAIAKSLIASGVSINVIMKSTQLSKDEILKLKSEC